MTMSVYHGYMVAMSHQTRQLIQIEQHEKNLIDEWVKETIEAIKIEDLTRSDTLALLMLVIDDCSLKFVSQI